MQIKGVGNNQIGNSYQNPNRTPNSATGKKEEDDVSKRLEALGVKVELSFQQTGTQPQSQEKIKETAGTEKSQETFSVLEWIKKIWDAGIAWLKSFWNDEQSADVMQTELPGEDAGEMFETDVELVAETPVDEDADYAAMYAKAVADEETSVIHEDKYRTTGTALHTSGMQDSYNRYGQHSKLGVEPVGNMTARK